MNMDFERHEVNSKQQSRMARISELEQENIRLRADLKAAEHRVERLRQQRATAQTNARVAATRLLELASEITRVHAANNRVGIHNVELEEQLRQCADMCAAVGTIRDEGERE